MVDDFGTGARFVTAVGEAGDALVTVITDQDGNKGVECVDVSAAKTD